MASYISDSQLQAKINALEKQAHEHNNRANDHLDTAKQASMQNNKPAYEQAKQNAKDERQKALDCRAEAESYRKLLKQKEQRENQKSREFQKAAQERTSHSVAADSRINDGTSERIKGERNESVTAQQRTERAMEAERKVQEAKQREAVTRSDNGHSR